MPWWDHDCKEAFHQVLRDQCTTVHVGNHGDLPLIDADFDLGQVRLGVPWPDRRSPRDLRIRRVPLVRGNPRLRRGQGLLRAPPRRERCVRGFRNAHEARAVRQGSGVVVHPRCRILNCRTSVKSPRSGARCIGRCGVSTSAPRAVRRLILRSRPGDEFRSRSLRADRHCPRTALCGSGLGQEDGRHHCRVAWLQTSAEFLRGGESLRISPSNRQPSVSPSRSPFPRSSGHAPGMKSRPSESGSRR